MSVILNGTAEQAAEKRSFPVVFLSVERMRRDF
jgi:hypothetical protein